MLKKIILPYLIVSSIVYASELNVNVKTLTGTTKLACEAILCLSSSTRPSECNKSISHYFSIHKIKWKDTLKARKSFLNLCPIGGADNDINFTNHRDMLVNITEPCDLKNLNRLEERRSYPDDDVKVNPTLTKSCQLLINSSYSNIKPKFTCNPKKWYKKTVWERGYEIKVISEFQYKKLNEEEQKEYTQKQYMNSEANFYTAYEKKIDIKKECWVWE